MMLRWSCFQGTHVTDFSRRPRENLGFCSEGYFPLSLVFIVVFWSQPMYYSQFTLRQKQRWARVKFPTDGCAKRCGLGLSSYLIISYHIASIISFQLG